MQKIIFTGAQGTGKTTVLNHFKEAGKEVITEVVRNLANEGVKINEMGDENGQKKIFKTYEDILSQPKDYISDRGLIDVLAYTMYLEKRGKVSSKLVNAQKKAVKKFIKETSDVVYCYFPIEFNVVDDGVRSLDEDFRKEIDDNIKSILVENKLTYVTIRGSEQARINMVSMLYNWLNWGILLFHESFKR